MNETMMNNPETQEQTSQPERLQSTERLSKSPEQSMEQINKKLDAVDALLRNTEGGQEFFVENMNKYLEIKFPMPNQGPEKKPERPQLKYKPDTKEITLSIDTQQNELVLKLQEIIDKLDVQPDGILVDENQNKSADDSELHFVVQDKDVKLEGKEKQKIADSTAGELLAANNENFLGKNFLEKMEDGSFRVDFHGNRSAELNIGMSDLLPAGITQVQVITPDGKIMNGTRQGLKGGFYTDTGRYIAVFTDYKIKPTQTMNQEDLDQALELRTKQAAATLQKPEIQKLYIQDGQENPEAKQEVSKIVDKATEYGIDPDLLIALWRTEQDQQSAFGIMKQDLNTLDGQLVMMARTVQSLEQIYIHKAGEQPTQPGSTDYKPEYILFLANALRTKQAMSSETKSYFTQVLNNYAQIDGKSYSESQIDDMITQFRQSKVAQIDTMNRTAGPYRRGLDMQKINTANLEMGNTAGIDVMSMSFEELLATPGGRDFQQYQDTILAVCDRLQIPAQLLLNLMIKEGSHGNPYATPPGSSAVGLGQIIDGTWSDITHSIAPTYNIDQTWDRYNPDHQILGCALYLRHMYDMQSDWSKALVHYHTGPGGVHEGNVHKYARRNPAISRGMSATTPEQYYASAERYYTSA